MKAVVHERFGFDGVDFRDVPVPAVGDDQVLVRVRASSVNPLEWYDVSAPPFYRLASGQLRRPKDLRLGADFAGTVESAGKDVKGLVAGDEVFGTAGGSWAEYAVAQSSRVAIRAEAISVEDAASLPIAGLTALQALRDVGKVSAGHKVLVNGASGGVGTYAVQIAKALGADVTAVCSTNNVEQTSALGADRVIDYTKEDFASTPIRHDVLIDIRRQQIVPAVPARTYQRRARGARRGEDVLLDARAPQAHRSIKASVDRQKAHGEIFRRKGWNGGPERARRIDAERSAPVRHRPPLSA